MKGGRVCPSHDEGGYGVVPPRALHIVAIYVLQNRLPHDISGRRHLRRLSPIAASVEEQGDDQCGSESSHSVQSWKRTF